MVAGMILPRFEFAAPQSIADACRLLGEAGGEARCLAGGTDLLVKMKRGALRPRLVVSLGRIRGFCGVEVLPDGAVRVGALATMAVLAGEVALASPALRGFAEGAASVGGPIIRNRATVGGNIVTARPCADTLPPLLALRARLRLDSTLRSRTVAVDGFVTGPGQTALEPDEILSGIEIPPPGSGRLGSAYLKFTRRSAMEVTIVGCAAALRLDAESDKIVDAGIVLSSVGPRPLRCPRAEAALRGRPAGQTELREAARLARAEALPIDDHRAPAALRREVVEVLVRRALDRALARAQGGAS